MQWNLIVLMRLRKLRQAVDAINPEFLLVLYPAPGTLLMTEALYPEWATARAPMVLADAIGSLC